MAEDYIIEETGDAPVTVYNLPETEDAKQFEAAWHFFNNTQHDHLDQYWDGSSRDHKTNYLRERYFPRGFIPLNAGSPANRKPDMPVPMASVIVSRNTGLMLGSPTVIKVAADEDTQEVLRAVVKSNNLRVMFAQGRNMAGGGGTAVEIPSVIGGKIHLGVYKPSEFKVLKWSDAESWQPERIIRQVLVELPVRDRAGKRSIRPFWQTTEWNKTDRITYRTVPIEWEEDKPIPETQRVPHGAQRCPATWYRNTPGETPWGLSDFEGLEPMLDQSDRLSSHVFSAIGKNCDPTLVQSDDAGTRRRHQPTRTGRGQLLQTSEKGRFELLESSGTSMDIGLRARNGLVEETFRLASVVHVTPETAGSLKSGEALRILWRDPEVRVGWLWPQREVTMRRNLECIYEMLQRYGVSSYEQPRKNSIILPSREMPAKREPPKAPEIDEQTGMPKPVEVQPPPPPTLVPHKVGKFGFIELTQGPYFTKTPSEIQAELGALQVAAGGVGVKLISEETAVEEAAAVLEIDPTTELQRLLDEKQRAVDEMRLHQGALKEDAEEEPGEEPGADAPKPAADDAEGEPGEEEPTE